jgi:hypothetical protein
VIKGNQSIIVDTTTDDESGSRKEAPNGDFDMIPKCMQRNPPQQNADTVVQQQALVVVVVILCSSDNRKMHAACETYDFCLTTKGAIPENP